MHEFEHPHNHGDEESCKHHVEFMGAEILNVHRELARQALERANGDPLQAQMILFDHYGRMKEELWPLSVSILAIHIALTEQMPQL